MAAGRDGAGKTTSVVNIPTLPGRLGLASPPAAGGLGSGMASNGEFGPESTCPFGNSA